jgi:hypothetical protein
LAQNGGVNKIQEYMEAHQRRMGAWMEQQRKQMANGTTASYEKSRAFMQLQQSQQQEFQRNISKLAQSFKEELAGAVNGLIDKLFTDFAANETTANATRMLAAATLAIQQQQATELQQQQQRVAASAAFMMPSAAASIYSQSIKPNLTMPYTTASPITNLFGAPSSSTSSAVTNSIFPSAAHFPQNFGPFSAAPPLFSAMAASLRGSAMDDSPRKKRSKVTDSVRGPRSSAVRDTSNSLPASERSSPQSAYFPPTMVSHPLYSTNFGVDNRVDTASNSGDDFSDYGSYELQSSTLTHVHLRKAKLMFFYTRYPSSAVLKSYFPDIKFNKNNTAQLVKWFSNFREFFYMQMEKYAKQAIAEGIKDKDEIFVSTDSEIYKQLNQHYNRNNVIEPPERLVYVIQETLKEFFIALVTGRDAEPSWKKTIYKVIQQLDETIPDNFKDPNFMEILERN